MEAEEPIITFETYSDPVLAHIIQTRLEANDIPCFVDESVGNVYPLYDTALGRIKLKIFARDLERCRAILAEDESLPADFPETENVQTPTCPNCGSDHVTYNGKQSTGIIGTIVSLFTEDKPWHCDNCGKDFE